MNVNPQFLVLLAGSTALGTLIAGATGALMAVVLVCFASLIIEPLIALVDRYETRRRRIAYQAGRPRSDASRRS